MKFFKNDHDQIHLNFDGYSETKFMKLFYNTDCKSNKQSNSGSSIDNLSSLNTVNITFYPKLSIREPNQLALNYLLKNYKKTLWNNPSYDCSEIATEFFNATNHKGIIIKMNHCKGNIIDRNIYINEYQKVKQYLYHIVYCDGIYVFDPRNSPNPELLSCYIKEIQLMNPGILFITLKE
jgi:hypothetical protein